MASGNKQRKQEQQQSVGQYNTAFTQAQNPSPLQSAQEKESLDWLSWENGAGPHDVTTAPGVGPYLDLFHRAKAGKARHRVGTAAFGAQFADPNLLAQMDREDQSAREENAGGALEDAIAMKSAQAHGSVVPLTQLQLQRNGMLLGAAGQRLSGANYAVNSQVPWYMRFLDNAAQGAGAAAAGGG
jgi:hypothetical protein